VTGSRAKVTGRLDPFRERQKPAVAGRFLKEQERHRRQADLMWLGVLASQFTEHEVRLLDDLGFLSQHDRDLLEQVRKARR
jgi:hypothetical protein